MDLSPVNNSESDSVCYTWRKQFAYIYMSIVCHLQAILQISSLKNKRQWKHMHIRILLTSQYIMSETETLSGDGGTSYPSLSWFVNTNPVNDPDGKWNIWAAAWQNQQNDLCAQRRLRSHCYWKRVVNACSVRCTSLARIVVVSTDNIFVWQYSKKVP